MCAEDICIGIRCGGRRELRLGVVDFRDEVVAECDEVRFVVDRAVRVDRYAEAGFLREARAVVVDAAEEDVEHEQRGQDEEEVAEEVAQWAGDGSEKMRRAGCAGMLLLRLIRLRFSAAAGGAFRICRCFGMRQGSLRRTDCLCLGAWRRMKTACASPDGTAQLLREIEEHEKDQRVEQQLHHGEGQQAHHGADAETQHAINVVGVHIREGR